MNDVRIWLQGCDARTEAAHKHADRGRSDVEYALRCLYTLVHVVVAGDTKTRIAGKVGHDDLALLAATEIFKTRQAAYRLEKWAHLPWWRRMWRKP